MDEKFVKEQEAKAFDEALANDFIFSLQKQVYDLQKQVDDLLEFIAWQSVRSFESDCRNKAIEGMGRKAYLSFLIKKGEQDALEDDDWNYIVELINKD